MPSSTTSSATQTNGARSVMSSMGAKLSRVLSRDGTTRSTASDVETLTGETKGPVPKSTSVTVKLPGIDVQSQSQSPVRGRELFSTGRGGAGNIHRSLSRDAATGPEYSTSPPPHGRETSATREPVTHVGRGGAGNIRDPSRPREQAVDPVEVIHEHEVVEQYDGSPHRFSTGRGGAGNIQMTDRSLSRERGSVVDQRLLSRGRPLHSTGRGGAGNISSDPLQEEEAEELERRAYSPSRPGELHSTGRGGLANVTTLTSPPIEQVVEENGAGVEGELVSVGRGGAGNIHDRRRSASRGGVPGSGGRSESRGRGSGEGVDAHHHGAIGKLIDRVKGYSIHEHQQEHHGDVKVGVPLDGTPLDSVSSSLRDAK